MWRGKIDSKGLLKRLRELMVEPLKSQQRLERIVQEIAKNMKVEVCSLYILHSDGILELYATKGLNSQAAIHLSQLRLGQGLVGTIAATARPLNLVNVQDYQAFAYPPETGEELYSSFLGVPILRAGCILGVLVVQNRNQRSYSDDEVEVLETIVMVLAEMISSRDLPKIADRLKPFSLIGGTLNTGVGIGHVFLHESRVTVTKLFHEDREEELEKLSSSLRSVRSSIDTMLTRTDVARDGEHRDVLETYRMFAHDKGWVRRLENAICNGLTAEAAVEKVQRDMRARMIQISNPYMRDRLSDFNDLSNRLLLQLMGQIHSRTVSAIENTVLVARSMGAVELLDYPQNKICGLVLEDGAITSHVVIVARAMGIPVIGQAKGIFSLSETGDPIIIDGDQGKIYLRPVIDVEKAYVEKVQFQERRQKICKNLRDKPARTRDGVRVTMLVNAGLLVDLPHIEECGADGIGLFRTELQFMIASTFPRSEEQEKLYRAVYRDVGTKPVVFRTLDIGGDKILPYFRSKGKEENPALGWRALRLTLDRPALMRTQLRALLKAAKEQDLYLMLPMVTEITEIHAVRQLIEREKCHLSRFGYALPQKISLGAMIEVPALLHQLDELMQAVDFVSVGSNDLFHFFMAADRGSAQLSGRFDFLAPAFLRALRSIVRSAYANCKPITLCGEMAGKPLTAMALIGLGFRHLSMAPASIGPVKTMILSLTANDLSEILDEELNKLQSKNSLRNTLISFARKNNVNL